MQAAGECQQYTDLFSGHGRDGVAQHSEAILDMIAPLPLQRVMVRALVCFTEGGGVLRTERRECSNRGINWGESGGGGGG